MDDCQVPQSALPAQSGGKHALAIRIGLIVLVISLPILMACLFTFLSGNNPFRAIPVWSDEPWWFLQYGAMSKYGRPLGYFGYGGTHADVGTFGPWGMFPALITGTLARIFGWGPHAFVYYNFFYLAASVLIFILLTKPDRRALLMMAAVNAMMYIGVCFSLIAMNEVLRYAMAVVLSGVMVRLWKEPQVSRIRLVLRWTLIPVLLVYSMWFYLPLVLFIPIYIVLMLRRVKPVWRVLAAAVVTVLALKFLRGVNSATCAPFIDPDRVDRPIHLSWQLELMAKYYSFLDRLVAADPLYVIFRSDSDAHRMTLWFSIMVYGLMGVLAWRVIVALRDKNKRAGLPLNLLCLFILVGFWGGILLKYSSAYTWTYVRTCNTGLCCVMLLACLTPPGRGPRLADGCRVRPIGPDHLCLGLLLYLRHQRSLFHPCPGC